MGDHTYIDSESIWQIILKYCPSPEIHEIRSLLGSKLLDRNESLWNEIDTLQHIYNELTSLDEKAVMTTDRDFQMNDAQFPRSRRLEQAPTFPGNDSLNLDLSQDDPFHEVVQAVIINQGSFETILRYHQEIVSSIEEENLALEARVTLLNDVISHISETGSRPTTSSSAKHSIEDGLLDDETLRQNVTITRACSHCSRISTVIETYSSNEIDSVGRGKKYTCALCKDVERKERRLTKLMDGKSESGVGRVNSKFRNKLLCARDELHFLDSFDPS